MLAFRSYEGYREQRIETEMRLGTPRGLAERKIDRELSLRGLVDDASYAMKCSTWVDELKEDIIRPLLPAVEGLVVYQFADKHNQVAYSNIVVAGQALLDLCSSRRGVYLHFEAAPDTGAHEIGHCLGLHHAPIKGNEPAEASDAALHDPADKNCLMGYEDNKVGFCGMCMLRLRGWQIKGKVAGDGSVTR
jgi:hypothetical protein